MKRILVLWMLLVAQAHADVFIWENTSGKQEMWGIPPQWYRNNDWTGYAPRTKVYINDRLVDDTGEAVSREAADYLRESALERAYNLSKDSVQVRARLRQAQRQASSSTTEPAETPKQPNSETKPPAKKSGDIVEDIKKRVK